MSEKAGLEYLVTLNLDDMMKAFGLHVPLLRTLFTPFLRPSALAFAKSLRQYDDAVKEQGLQAASAQFSQAYVAGIKARGLEHLPSDGPLLILSNHPGLADTVSLFSKISRGDLKVIALDRPFLRALPGLSKNLYLLSDKAGQRADVLKRSVRHLRRGGAILTFPAGQIEPDPFVRKGALASVDDWSDSLPFFTRLVPELKIVVVMVAGVFSPLVLKNPVVRLRPVQKRELFAAALQLAWRHRTNTVSMAFTKPLEIASIDSASLKESLKARVKEALEVLEAYY